MTPDLETLQQAFLCDLNRCWCCDTTGVVFEMHHIVPRHLGGEQGPQVQLCGGCHTLLHTYATQKYNRKVSVNIDHYVGESLRRLEYLTDVIVRARIAIEGQDVTKKWKFSLTLSHEMHTKVVQLAKIYGSQEKAVLVAINALHGKNCS